MDELKAKYSNFYEWWKDYSKDKHLRFGIDQNIALDAWDACKGCGFTKDELDLKNKMSEKQAVNIKEIKQKADMMAFENMSLKLLGL